jgi:hypothetical protein
MFLRNRYGIEVLQIIFISLVVLTVIFIFFARFWNTAPVQGETAKKAITSIADEIGPDIYDKLIGR